MKNKRLRTLSREQLGNNVFRNRWITMMAICVVAIGVDTYLMCIAPFTGFLIGPVFALVVGGPLFYGSVKALLECADGERWSFTHVLHGFLDCFSGAIILGFLEWFFITVWSLLFIVPGIVKSYSYAFAFHIQCENPDKEAIDCLKESCALMKGNKRRLFKLDVSFLGWYLLGMLCAGVGFLFVVPYHQLARTNFYRELQTKDDERKMAEMIERLEKEAETENK